MKSIVLFSIFYISINLSYSQNFGTKIYPAPEGTPRAYDFSVLINGDTLDLYGAQTRYGNLASFGYFESDFNDSVQVEIIAHFGPHHSTTYTFLPERHNIRPLEWKNRYIRFKIGRPMDLTVLITGDYHGNVLHLFATKPYETLPDTTDPNVIYFGPGYHVLPESNGWQLKPKSKQTVYLAPGAFVKGSILIEKAHNVNIYGRGILYQDYSTNREIGIEIDSSHHITIDGIIEMRERHHWCGLMINSHHINITNYKVVAPDIWSSDGFNAINSQHIVYDNCFMRCGDDCIAIKGFGSTGGRHINDNPNNGGPNEDITIQNSIFWSDNNNVIVLGQESKADYYKDITVRNCDLLYQRPGKRHNAALSIICVHSTDYNNILFEDIRIGPAGMMVCVFYPDMIFRSMAGDHQWPGEMNGITFRNVSATGLSFYDIKIHGYAENKLVKNITFENVRVNDKLVGENYPYLDVNTFVKGLRFK